MISDIADRALRSVESVKDGVHEALFEPVIRLGVTGLSRAGKTVFITSLIANLMDRGRMPQFAAAPRITAAFLQPQPDDTVPRFEYETHLAALTSPTPHWPESTRAVSELRLSFKVNPSGVFGRLAGPRTVHLDIVDYPGEWLLDLGLMEKSYAEWSKQMLARPHYGAFGSALEGVDPTEKFDELRAQELAKAFTACLTKARADGYSDCSPGRFLLPGDLEGSPVLTFAPLPQTQAPRGSMAREFERRFEAYKRQVVRPFFRDHFARLDRQVVLIDALSAIHSGPQAVEDLRQTMADILRAFRPGHAGRLLRLVGWARIDKILFAATKADHIHQNQHAELTAIVEALVRDAKDRADFAGAKTAALSLASLRATDEDHITHDGRALDVVRGRTPAGKTAAFYPGLLPEDPNALLSPARSGAEAWLDAEYDMMRFEPAPLTLKPGEGPPHIRLDRAAQFLIGDKL